MIKPPSLWLPGWLKAFTSRLRRRPGFTRNNKVASSAGVAKVCLIIRHPVRAFFGPDKDLARAVQGELDSYRSRRAACIPAGKASLDHASLNALVASLDAFSVSEIRECSPKKFASAYRSLLRAGEHDLMIAGNARSEIRSPSIDDLLGQLGAIETGSIAPSDDKTTISWANAILIEYLMQAEGSSAGAMKRVVTSIHLRRLLLQPRHSEVLESLASRLSSRPFASVVLCIIARASRVALDDYCRENCIGRLQAAMEFLLEDRLDDQQSVGEANPQPTQEDRLIASSPDAQDLWLHMVGLLLPSIRFFDELKGVAKVEHDWCRLVQRLLDYEQDAVGRFVAAHKLASWFPVPPFMRPLCGALMAWCYWNSVNPLRKPIQVIVDGVPRKLWPMTFDKYSALANKPVHWSQLELRFRGDRATGVDYACCVLCGGIADIPPHQYEGLRTDPICSLCRWHFNKSEQA